MSSKLSAGTRAAATTAALFGLGAIRARRRRLRKAAEGLRDTVSPPGTPDPLFEEGPGPDVAHAPGHQHLGPPPGGRRTRRRRGWSQRADTTGYGGRFSGSP